MTDWVTLKDIPAMTGLTQATVYVYRSVGRLPAADGKVGYTPVWHRETIRVWNETRRKQ